jgi:hypothetical protein
MVTEPGLTCQKVMVFSWCAKKSSQGSVAGVSGSGARRGKRRRTAPKTIRNRPEYRQPAGVVLNLNRERRPPGIDSTAGRYVAREGA